MRLAALLLAAGTCAQAGAIEIGNKQLTEIIRGKRLAAAAA